jgi:pyridoxal phosphate-dependent aminotransferase EpsN
MSRIYLSPPDISPQDHAAIEAVLASNWVAPVGPDLAAFETAVAARVGRTQALALNSGTAALHLALAALGIGPGDAVICPTLTFAASANPICYLGADPIFVDSEPRTWNIDPARLKVALEAHPEVKAVIVVHLYGQCADVEAIERLCRQYGVRLIEDAAEALGASCGGRMAGAMGKLSFFSFNGNKIITTSGGGMLLGDDAELVDKARYLASQAREPVRHYEHRAIGFNYRLSNLLAGLGLSQFADLDRRIAARRKHFEAYREALGDLPGLRFMPVKDPDAVNYWLTCLTLEPAHCPLTRDQLIDQLEANDIEARPIWKPLHLQPIFSERAYYGGSVAADLFSQGLCLPSGSGLSDDERERVIATIREAFQSAESSA